MKRIGIFGGTFAPIHMGHVQCAQAFVTQFYLQTLYLIPDRIPPHKEVCAGDDPMSRLAMVRLAAAQMGERITVSDWEISRPGKSYSFDTLTHFQERDTTLYCLVGTDMFLTLPQWYRGEELFSLARMVCSPRKADGKQMKEILAAQKNYREKYGAETYLLEWNTNEVSSTEIREKIRRGQSVHGLIPEDVERYIMEHHLYGA